MAHQIPRTRAGGQIKISGGTPITLRPLYARISAENAAARRPTPTHSQRSLALLHVTASEKVVETIRGPKSNGTTESIHEGKRRVRCRVGSVRILLVASVTTLARSVRLLELFHRFACVGAGAGVGCVPSASIESPTRSRAFGSSSSGHDGCARRRVLSRDIFVEVRCVGEQRNNSCVGEQ